MGTYYGYVERTADSYINWAEIGKNFSDTIAEVDRKRQEKKAEIDKSVKEVIDYLANSPQGESKTVRGMALEYSGNATEYLLDLQRKLKAGQIKLDDFLSKRQNIEDGTERAFTMMSEYQKEYGDRMERYRKGESSILEVENMSQIENFGDFSKSGLFINPLTGAVNVAMKEERDIDGKKVFAMSANPSKIMSIDSARNLLTTKYNIYDYNKVSEAFSKTMGKNVEAIYKSAGLTGTIEDITSREYKDPKTKEMIFNFQQAETKGIEALLSNWSDRASLLLDNNVPCSANGELYRITYDPNDKAPEAVYVEVDAQGRQNVNFTDVQKKDSFNFMRDDIRRRYTYVENIKRETPSGGGGGDTEGAKWRSERKNAQTAWNQMFYGDPAMKQSAANALLNTPAAISKGLVDIDFSSSPGEMILTFRDKEGSETTQTIVMDPNKTTFGEFAQQGSVVSGITDMNEAIRIGGNPMKLAATDLTPNASFGTTKASKEVQAAPDYAGVYNSYISKNLTPELINATESEVVPKLKALFGGLGFSFEESGAGLFHNSYVTITSPDQKASKEFPVYEGEEDSKATAQEMFNWMAANSNSSAQANAFETGFLKLPEKKKSRKDRVKDY